MRCRFIAGCLIAVSGLAACANEGTSAEKPASVEERLQRLPTDTEARAKALDSLLTEFPGDSRIERAAKDFEIDTTPGLLRSVEFADGRQIVFMVLDFNAYVAETGRHGQGSIIAELGLSDLSPAEMWRRLIPKEDVPAILAEIENRGNTSAERGLASEEAVDSLAGVAGKEDAASLMAKTGNSDVAVAEQAYTATPDAFLVAGGCATRPTPTGADYSSINATYCNTQYTGDGMWTAYNSWQARWHVDNPGSGVFLVTLLRNGTTITNKFVFGGSWWNFGLGIRYYTDTNDCCCDFLCISACGCPIKIATDNLRLEVSEAAGNTMRVGAVYFSSVDNRTEAQPWR